MSAVQEAVEQVITADGFGYVGLDLGWHGHRPPVEIVPDEWLWSGTTPWGKQISGGRVDPHVTLIYGLLRPATTWLLAIDELLADWDRPLVLQEFGSIKQFGHADDPYVCLGAPLILADRARLADANGRLRRLPHVASFARYRPHITLAYVQPEHARPAADAMSRALAMAGWATVLGMNYGADS